jgi:hypothetical protein
MRPFEKVKFALLPANPEKIMDAGRLSTLIPLPKESKLELKVGATVVGIHIERASCP